MSAFGKSIRAADLASGVARAQCGGLGRRQQISRNPDAADLPVAQAREGEFLVIIRCRGELAAGRSAQIYAPLVPNLRIAWMAGSGEVVKKGAPVIRFDSSTVEQQLVQKQAQLAQAQASLDQEKRKCASIPTRTRAIWWTRATTWKSRAWARRPTSLSGGFRPRKRASTWA